MTLYRSLLLLLALLFLNQVGTAQPEIIPPAAQPQPAPPLGPFMPNLEGGPVLTLPAPAPKVEQPIYRVKLLRVIYQYELLLDLEDARNPLHRMKPFFPEGVIEVQPLAFDHAIVVKARNEEDIDQLEMMLKLIDQPQKQILLHVLLVKLPLAEANLFADKSIDIFTKYTVENKRQLKDLLERSIAAGKVEIVDAALVMLQEGNKTTINFTSRHPGVPAFNVKAFMHPTDELTLTAEPLPDALLAGAWSSPVRLLGGTTFVLASDLPIDNAEEDSTGMIFVTTAYCKAGKEAVLRPEF